MLEMLIKNSIFLNFDDLLYRQGKQCPHHELAQLQLYQSDVHRKLDPL